jgi:hypothetical protein
MSLFEELPGRPEPMSASETWYRFMCRSSDPVFARIRSLIEKWFAQFPTKRHKDLKARIRSGDDRQFLHAFWELYLYQMLSRLGYVVTLPPVTRPNPDFLVRTPEGSFYLEATSLSADSDLGAAAQRRLGRVEAAINGVEGGRFRLSFEPLQVGAEELPLDGLLADITRRFKALSSLDEAVVGAFEPYVELWDWEWSFADWRLGFSAMTISESIRRNRVPTIAVSGGLGGGLVSDEHLPLRGRLLDKANHYGDLDHPLAIAVHVDRWESWGSTAQSLLGNPAGSSGIQQADGIAMGVWDTPEGNRISAVLIVEEFRPQSVARIAPGVWLNSKAPDLPMRFPLETLIRDAVSGAMRIEPATITPAELFELPPDWPGTPFQ